MRELKRVARASLVIVVLCTLGCSATGTAATNERALTRDLFVLENGFRDGKHRTLQSRAKTAAELGYIGIAPLKAALAAKYLPVLDQYKLQMSALYVRINLDNAKHPYSAALPQAIKLLKGRRTVIWLYLTSKRHKPSTTTADELAVNVVRQVGQMCKASGLKVALYPHVGFYVATTTDALRVVDQVSMPNVGVAFNLCHFLKQNKPTDLEPTLKQAIDKLFIVTTNGADHAGSWKQLIQPLDRGEFDQLKLLRLLNDLGYRGPIGLQCYGIRSDSRIHLGRSIAAWKKLSDELDQTLTR